MLRLALFVAAILAWVPVARAQEAGPEVIGDLAADDLRQISDIIARWERAWQAHDMQAFGQLFHEDATFVVWNGLIWQGRQAIEDGHAAAHRTYFRESVQLSNPLEFRAVAPGVVVSRFVTTLTGDERSPGETMMGHKLLVLTERDGKWGILFGQNTRLSPPAIDALRSQGLK